VLQSIITAAKKYASHATAEYNRQAMLRQFQEASDEEPDSLAWFTNTIVYNRWQEGDKAFIYYPITLDSASSGHDNIAAALFYHLRARFASKAKPFCHIFYFKPSGANSDSVTYPALDYQEMYRSLISQALMTYDCLKDKLLLMKTHQGLAMEKLTLLFTTNQALSLVDLTKVLALIIENILNSTESKDTLHSVILVIDRIGQVDDKFRNFVETTLAIDLVLSSLCTMGVRAIKCALDSRQTRKRQISARENHIESTDFRASSCLHARVMLPEPVH
jgi:hypothetical protein